MKHLLTATLLAATLHGTKSATAQGYPSRPIVVVVPFTAGGPTDALMRVLGERMRASLDQPLLVENVTGAAGTIGVAKVARATPNGYTLSVGHWSTLSYAILRAVWAEDRDIADHATLVAIANEQGLDGKGLLAATEDAAVQSEYQSNTEEAMKIGVFGAPTYVFDGELFWGQDRLQMLEWRLTQKLGAPKTTTGVPA